MLQDQNFFRNPNMIRDLVVARVLWVDIYESKSTKANPSSVLDTAAFRYYPYYPWDSPYLELGV